MSSACIYSSSRTGKSTQVNNNYLSSRPRTASSMSMTPDAAFALEIAVVAALVVLIVAIVVASSGACDPEPAAAAAVHDVERALGADTLLTYDQAKAAFFMKSTKASSLPEGKEEAPPPPSSCAICLSEYAGGEERVRVVPACGHFFHAECGIDWWLRTRGTCPYCRAELRPLPGCPRMPPRSTVGRTSWVNSS